MLTTRLGAAVDRVALGVMRRIFNSTGGRRQVTAETVAAVHRMRDFYARAEWLARPDLFFAPPEGAPAVAEERRGARDGLETVDIAFPSRYLPHAAIARKLFAGYAENATVYARQLRGAPGRPTIVCLHGWGGGGFALEARVFVARWLARIGLDVVLFQLPFHGKRTPARARFSGQLFPSAHIARTNEAFGQAVHDLRSLALWLRARGSPVVGLAGFSLGGYTTALLASLDAVDFAVAAIPVADLATLMWAHGEGRPERRRAEKLGITVEDFRTAWRVHSPLARPCLVAPERRLIVAGRGDRITPAEHAEALWEHWGRCRIHWFQGGHLMQFGRGEGWREMRRMLAEGGVIR